MLEHSLLRLGPRERTFAFTDVATSTSRCSMLNVQCYCAEIQIEHWTLDTARTLNTVKQDGAWNENLGYNSN